MTKPAVLALADGNIFHGEAIGADGQTVGEVVFSTAMTGYQEILTDPSYVQQIVTLTYPHIDNTGTIPGDAEASCVWTADLIIHDLPLIASNWRSRQSLPDYLEANGTIAIAGIDTRRLTRILREKGSQNGCILAGADATGERTLELARAFPDLKGMDLAKEVTTAERYEWHSSVWNLESDSHPEIPADELPYHAVAYDYGVKLNIPRMLVACGYRLTVVPAQTLAGEVLVLSPDGIFLSNGPDDPEPCDYAIQATREFPDTEIPVLGIRLGHQLLVLAFGAKTLKMGHGHHGANRPVQDPDSGVMMITSQNHGFAVDESTLPDNLRATHKSLFDGTLQGIERTDKAAFSFQGRPEASPGPHDVAPLFDCFISTMAKRC